MADQDEGRTAAAGLGMAGFALALHSIGLDLRSGRISKADAIDIISRARGFLSRVPGDEEVVSFAESALKDAEQVLSTALAQTPPAGPN
jgi:hypothetical protein